MVTDGMEWRAKEGEGGLGSEWEDTYHGTCTSDVVYDRFSTWFGTGFEDDGVFLYAYCSQTGSNDVIVRWRVSQASHPFRLVQETVRKVESVYSDW